MSQFNVIVAVTIVGAVFSEQIFSQVTINFGGWFYPGNGWDYIYNANEGEDRDGEADVRKQQNCEEDDPNCIPDENPIESLDGTWIHNNGSDAWDGSGPNDQFRPDGMTPHAPGGVGITFYPGLGENGSDASVLTMVDIGDPRALGYTDPSNRKIWLIMYPYTGQLY